MGDVRCTVCKRDDRPTIDRFLRNGNSLRAVADETGLSRSALDRHRAHLGQPGTASRKAAGAAPPSKPHRPSARPSARPAVEQTPAAPAHPSTTEAPLRGLDLARALEDEVAAQIARVRSDSDLTIAARSRLLASACQSLATVGRMTGTTSSLTEAQLVAHPLLRAMARRILGVLRPWPDALEAVANALDAVDGDAR